MTPTRCVAWTLALALLTGVAAPPARSSISRPLTLPELVRDSEFVGVVRCVTAGIHVARFEVLDTWKGTSPADAITLGIGFAGRPPIVLVGDAFVVFASAPESQPAGRPSEASGRRRVLPIDADVGTPKRAIPLRDLNPFSIDGRRAEVVELADLDGPMLELRVLRAVLAQSLHASHPLHGSLRSAVSLGDGVQLLLENVEDGDVGTACRRAIFALSPAEGLAILRSIAATDAAAKDRCARLIERLEGGVSAERPTLPPGRPASPSTAQVAAWEHALRAGPGERGFAAAFEGLTLHRPLTIAEYLATSGLELDDDRLHDLASSFSRHRCDDRAHLHSLLDAPAPMVRAAAAIQLRFDEPEAASPVLRELARDRSLAGDWAAVVLASRGDREAVETLLASPPRTPNSVGTGHLARELDGRLRVLLSNSAAASGLEAPPHLHRGSDSAQPDLGEPELLRWWREHADRVRLHDPWIDVLDPLRVD